MQRIAILSILTVVMIVVVVIGGDKAIAEAEAVNLWIVRDVESLDRADGLSQTARIALDNLQSAFSRTLQGAYPPLYPLTLEVWTTFTGDSLIAARLLSVLWTLAGLASLYALAVRMMKDNRAPLVVLVAGGIMVITPAMRQAIPHAMLFFFVTLASLVLYLWWNQPRRGYAPAYLALMTAALLTHFAAILIIVAHGAALLWRERRLTPFKAAVLALPVLISCAWMLIRQPLPDMNMAWEGDAFGGLGVILMALIPASAFVPKAVPVTAIVIAGAMLFGIRIPADWSLTLTELQRVLGSSRGHVLLKAYAPYSAAGYYDHTGDIPEIFSVDLHWKPERSDEELEALVGNITQEASGVWMMVDQKNTRMWRIISMNLVGESFAPYYCYQADSTLMHGYMPYNERVSLSCE